MDEIIVLTGEEIGTAVAGKSLGCEGSLQILIGSGEGGKAKKGEEL
jgi:hypothetical protein